MSHITFDYSKVLESFAGQHEIDFYKAKSQRPTSYCVKELDQVQISWAGLIFQKTMIKMNLHVS